MARTVAGRVVDEIGIQLTSVKVLLILSTMSYAVCLRMTSLRVPPHVPAHSTARLECMFDLEGEELYMVKWYKDGNEFYRYLPTDDQPALAFPEVGIPVDEENSTATQLVLPRVPLTAGGSYRCEVCAEAPYFHTVVEHADMMVVVLPDDGPQISGGKPRYHPGEWAELNCTSGGSQPVATLAWFINGEPATEGELLGPTHAPLPPPNHRLIATALALRFRVRPRHFRRGDLKLKCLATIGSLYSRSNEESVEGDRLQKGPALESRDAAAAATHDTRSHRAQASSVSGTSGGARVDERFRCLALTVLVLLSLDSERRRLRDT